MADPFYGEIRAFGFSFAPMNWASCNGAVLSTQQYQGLWAVIGFTYGGNNTTTFALPNLQGRAVAGSGSGPGLTTRDVGDEWGNTFVTLSTTQMPNHQHAFNGVVAPSTTLLVNEPSATAHLARTAGQLDFSSAVTPTTTMALQSLSTSGGSTPHENRQPYLAMNFCICVYGEFPIRA